MRGTTARGTDPPATKSPITTTRPPHRSLVGKYLREAFPRANITTRNGALPATPSALMNMCLETYVDAGEWLKGGSGCGCVLTALLCHLGLHAAFTRTDNTQHALKTRADVDLLFVEYCANDGSNT